MALGSRRPERRLRPPTPRPAMAPEGTAARAVPAGTARTRPPAATAGTAVTGPRETQAPTVRMEQRSSSAECCQAGFTVKHEHRTWDRAAMRPGPTLLSLLTLL